MCTSISSRNFSLQYSFVTQRAIGIIVAPSGSDGQPQFLFFELSTTHRRRDNRDSIRLERVSPTAVFGFYWGCGRVGGATFRVAVEPGGASTFSRYCRLSTS